MRLSTKKANTTNMIKLTDVDPEKFATSFTKSIVEVTEVLAAISGVNVRDVEKIEPTNIEEIARHVCMYALGKTARFDKTEMCVNMLGRVAYNKVMEFANDPDFDRVLKSVRMFAPQTEVDAVIFGALARIAIEDSDRVSVAWLAILGGISYANCLMHVHRGNLVGGRGMVTSASAKKWLEERASAEFEQIVEKVKKEAMPSRRRSKRAAK